MNSHSHLIGERQRPVLRPPDEKWLLFGWALIISGGLAATALLISPPATPFHGGWLPPLDAALRHATIAVALLIFLSGWNHQGLATNRDMVLAYGFLAVAMFDFAHLLSTASIPPFVSDNAPHSEMALCLATRGIAAGVLLARAFLPERELKHPDHARWLTFTVAASSLVLTGLLSGSEQLPALMEPGSGPTWIATALGTGIATALGAGLFALARGRAQQSWQGALLALGMAGMLMAELLFLLRVTDEALAHLAAFAYKLIAGGALYRLAHLRNIEMPYRELSQLRRDLIDKEHFLNTLITEAPDGVLVADEEGRIVAVNKQLLSDFGYATQDLIGQKVEILIPVAMRHAHVGMRESYARAPYNRPMGAMRDTIGLRCDGTTIPIEISLGSAIIRERRCIIAFVRDATTRHRLEDERSHLLTVLEESPDWILQADRDMLVTYTNPAARLAFGMGADPLRRNEEKLNLAELLDHADLSSPIEGIFSAARRLGVFAGETRFRSHSEGRVPVSIVVIAHRDSAGQLERYSLVARDISERVSWEQQLAHNATHDSLTGLPNRLVLMDRIQQAIDQANHGHEVGAIFFLDLDNFKLINDSFGHRAGDNVLVTVAQRLKECLRQGDTLARFGGDEFVVIAPGLRNVGDADGIADKLLAVMDKPVMLESTAISLNASIGICLLPQDASTAEDAMSHADQAMYRAKQSGRGQHKRYASELDSNSLLDVELTSALKEAIREQQGELSLHYQPQVRSSDGSIACTEALLRWNNEKLGQISPACFIPLAERTGLILELGQWVLNEACRQLVEWKRGGLHMRIAVNVSAQELRQENFAARLKQLLDRYELDYGLIELEVTETALINSISDTAENLHHLRALGMRVALDDFGTGYSSLAHLRSLPIDKLKIDREFVHGISTTQNNRFIVEAVIRLTQQLGLDVIAEGVETPEDLAVLSELGCDHVQGWLMFRPMVADECTSLIRSLQQPLQAEN